MSRLTIPNAKEKAFMNSVAEFGREYLGVLFNGYDGSPFQIHHCVGRSYRHSKVHIGHYFILPVPIELHDVTSNHPLNVTHHRKAFCAKYGNERDLWRKMYIKMAELEMCKEARLLEVYHSIMDTNR